MLAVHFGEDRTDGRLKLLKINIDPLFFQKDTKDAFLDDEEICAGLFEFDAKLAEIFRSDLGEVGKDQRFALFEKHPCVRQLCFFLCPCFHDFCRLVI